MKQLIKTVEKSSSIPVLQYICIKNGIATATDCEVFTSKACTAPDGLYNAKEVAEGIYNKSELSLDQFPIATPIKANSSLTIPAKQLLDALEFIKHAMSNEETRYYLKGAFFNTTQGEIVATDGHRLAKYKLKTISKLKVADKHSSGAGFILPKKTVELLLIEKNLKGDIKIQTEPHHAIFELPNGVSIRSKLIDGNYPDYNRVIPDITNATQFMINCKAWLKSYKTANKLRELKTIKYSKDGFEYAPNVFLNPENVSEGLQGGYGYQSKYLLEAITALDADKLVMKFNEPSDPAMYQDKTKTLILMPMRA